MMLRSLTVSVLFAVLVLPAYAQDSTPETPAKSTTQDNPQTRQTDESEDDYRRSQRRRDTGDIFDDIDINNRSSGSGTILGREVKAIDRLDQESRRHLNKQRAKALAEAQPGEPIDAAYEPSDVAKTDEYVAKQEERAWKEMMREANSGLAGTQGQGTGSGDGQGAAQGDSAQGQAGQQGQGISGAGQSGQGQSGQGQSGQGQDGPSAQPSPSPLRGGSASSASSILDQIKGRSGSRESGQPAGGGGQAPQGQAPQSGQASQGEANAQGQTQDASQSQTGSDGDAKSASDAKAAADAAAQAQADAQASANASEVNAAAEAAAHRETISPLERLKRDPVERGDAGGRTSASDYLNRKKD